MPRLSIVIPCIQEADHFEATLASVLQNRPDDCEVLVVQPRDYADPYELKDEVRFVQAPAESSLVDLINVGIKRSAGEIIHLLACHAEVCDGWTQRALEHFHDPTVGCVSPLVVLKSAGSHVVSRGVVYGSSGVRRIHKAAVRPHHGRAGRVLAPTLTAGLYRRQALLNVGGFSSEVGADLTDVDLGRMLQAAGYRCVHDERAVVTLETIPNVARLSTAAGLAAERLFWRNTDPSDRTCILLAHPWAWLTEACCNLYRPRIVLQWWGRVQGCLERARHAPHYHRVQALPNGAEAGRDEILSLDAPLRPERSAALSPRAAA